MFETAALSSAGGRPGNEDAVSYVLNSGRGCWVLADGLGGHLGGEVASKLAVDAVLGSFTENPDAPVATHFDHANRAILARQVESPELAHMRTTIVVLMASEDHAQWAHAGDSRLYWLRNGRIQEQTRDDSVTQRLVDAGEIPAEEIRFHEDRSRLLKCLGAREQVAPMCREPVPLEAGDAFLLASDGFWEYVCEAEMEEDFLTAASASAWVEKMEARLKLRAADDHDNYSAIAIRILNRQ